MKKLYLFVALLSLALAGCGNGQQTSAIPEKPAQVVPPMPVKDHEYSLKDGVEYGYERAVSAEEANQGKAASQLLMVRYAGTKGGDYQAYIKDGLVIAVFQCSNPCEFIKIMTYLDGEHVKTERMRATEGTVGWSVMADAINGKLQPYVGERNGRKFNVWFDERKGVQQIWLDAKAGRTGT